VRWVRERRGIRLSGSLGDSVDHVCLLTVWMNSCGVSVAQGVNALVNAGRKAIDS